MSTRICGGSERGRRLQLPAGRLRPTTERVRAAVFSILGGRVEGARVLDLYAGSGAMGLEALSRGALRAEMVEMDREACGAIEANIRSLGYGERAKVIRARVEKVVGAGADAQRLSESGDEGGAYEVVFVDPPYGDNPWEAVLGSLGEGSLLRAGAVVVAEHRASLGMADTYGNLSRTMSRRYGDSAITMFSAGGANG